MTWGNSGGVVVGNINVVDDDADIVFVGYIDGTILKISFTMIQISILKKLKTFSFFYKGFQPYKDWFDMMLTSKNIFKYIY